MVEVYHSSHSQSTSGPLFNCRKSSLHRLHKTKWLSLDPRLPLHCCLHPRTRIPPSTAPVHTISSLSFVSLPKGQGEKDLAAAIPRPLSSEFGMLHSHHILVLPYTITREECGSSSSSSEDPEALKIMDRV